MRKTAILLITASILISGCKVTEQKAKRWAYDNKVKLAEWCADCFPVKPVEIKPGIPVIKIDTVVQTSTDTLVIDVECPDGVIVPAKCPPDSRTYYRTTITVRDTVLIRDTAHERVLSDLLGQSEKALAVAHNSLIGWRKAFWCALASAVVLGLIVWFRR